jgi:hypothetical protein
VINIGKAMTMKTKIFNIAETFEIIDGNLWRKQYINKANRKIPSKLIKSVANSNKGYCVVSYNGEGIMFHRIVWQLVFGPIPKGLQIDHINGNKVDNRIENLRLVTNRENCQNYEWHRNGRLPGCYYRTDCNKWQARAKVNGITRHIGLYHTEQEAHEAYKKYVQNLRDKHSSHPDNQEGPE